jgi:hypothetical protein
MINNYIVNSGGACSYGCSSCTGQAVRDAQTVVQAARDVLELAQTDVMQVVQDAKVVVTTVCIGV